MKHFMSRYSRDRNGWNNPNWPNKNFVFQRDFRRISPKLSVSRPSRRARTAPGTVKSAVDENLNLIYRTPHELLATAQPANVPSLAAWKYVETSPNLFTLMWSATYANVCTTCLNKPWWKGKCTRTLVRSRWSFFRWNRVRPTHTALTPIQRTFRT